jgi:hypothetical protein
MNIYSWNIRTSFVSIVFLSSYSFGSLSLWIQIFSTERVSASATPNSFFLFSLSPILEFCFICWILNSDLDLRSRFSSKRYLLFDLFFWKEVTQKEEQDAEKSTQEGCFFISDFIKSPFVFRVCYWILNSHGIEKCKKM